LESWDAVARKLPVPKANLIEGQLIQLFSDWIDGVRLHGNWAEPEASLDGSTKFFQSSEYRSGHISGIRSDTKTPS